MITKLGIQRMENESDSDFITRVTVYITELENEALMWRAVFKEILHINNHLTAIFRIIGTTGSKMDEHCVMEESK